MLGTQDIFGLMMKIKSLTSLGIQRTYSPQMRSPYHNYILNSGVIHKNSHAICYCLWAYRCLWFKAHFPEEWWASVMGKCDQKALERYMVAARGEGVKFGEIDIIKLTLRPTAHPGENKHIALGLTSLKKIGEKAAMQFVDTVGSNVYNDIEDFIAKKGKNKTLFERLIKLGAFNKLHKNKRATWLWYLYEYGTGSVNGYEFDDVDDKAMEEITESKAQQLKEKPKLKEFSYPIKILKDYIARRVLEMHNWNEESITNERNRQIAQYKATYKKRKTVPAKIANWRPSTKASRKDIEAIFPNDYTFEQILSFEKEFLGYHWNSPIDLYHVSGNNTVDKSKINGCLEGVISSLAYAKTKKGSDMLRLMISDGRKTCLVLVWEQDIKNQPKKMLQENKGISIRVDYDDDRNSFMLKRGTVIEPLWTEEAWQKLMANAE